MLDINSPIAHSSTIDHCGISLQFADATMVCPFCGSKARTTHKGKAEFNLCACGNEGFTPVVRSAYLAQNLRDNQEGL
jgi:hypothetical protein